MTGGAYGAETSPGGGTCAARPGVAAAAGDSFVGTASCSSGVASAAVVRAGAGAAGAAAGATRRRICTTSCGSRRLVSASKAAWTTLTGFALPKDLDRMSLMPAASTTARTAPPAITPVPGAAGLSRTFAAPNFCTISCGIVVPAIGNHNDRAEREAAAALDDFGHAVDLDDFLFEGQAGRTDLFNSWHLSRLRRWVSGARCRSVLE